MQSSVTGSFSVSCILSPRGIERITLDPQGDGTIHITGDLDSNTKEAILRWFGCFFQKTQPKQPLPLDFSSCTLFQKKIYQSLLQIPLGKTISYKDLAEIAGFPKAYRAVGSAMHKNPFPIVVPCHRVITASGKIGGFAYGSSFKKRLLEFEN